MNQPVMMAAQQHQVFHRRFTTIGPMLNMVRIDKAVAGAAGKAATAIAPLQGAANGWWNGAALAPDAEGLAICSIQPVHQPGIAGHASCGFSGNISTLFQLGCASRSVLFEGFDIGVYMHHKAIPAVAAGIS